MDVSAVMVIDFVLVTLVGFGFICTTEVLVLPARRNFESLDAGTI